eukprot:361829-Chlamydomonas_euryale.AAC.1
MQQLAAQAEAEGARPRALGNAAFEAWQFGAKMAEGGTGVGDPVLSGAADSACVDQGWVRRARVWTGWGGVRRAHGWVRGASLCGGWCVRRRGRASKVNCPPPRLPPATCRPPPANCRLPPANCQPPTAASHLALCRSHTTCQLPVARPLLPPAPPSPFSTQQDLLAAADAGLSEALEKAGVADARARQRLLDALHAASARAASSALAPPAFGASAAGSAHSGMSCSAPASGLGCAGMSCFDDKPASWLRCAGSRHTVRGTHAGRQGQYKYLAYACDRMGPQGVG